MLPLSVFPLAGGGMGGEGAATRRLPAMLSKCVCNRIEKRQTQLVLITRWTRLLLHTCSQECCSGGLFLESPDTYQSLVLLPLFTFKISVYNMIKLSVFTNRNWLVCWVGLTLSFFRFWLEYLILHPEKIPGLSRNGSLTITSSFYLILHIMNCRTTCIILCLTVYEPACQMLCKQTTQCDLP